MKKLLLAVPFLALFSCNTEIPREQFVEKLTNDCMSKHATKFLGDSATKEQKDDFCACYVDLMAGDEEAVTVKSMMEKMKNAEAFTSQLEGCKTEALADDENVEAKPDVENKLEEVEEKNTY